MQQKRNKNNLINVLTSDILWYILNLSSKLIVKRKGNEDEI